MTKKICLCLALLAIPAFAKNIQFKSLKIADITYEAASAFDFNNDGSLDIIAGQFCFLGPNFKEKIDFTGPLNEGDEFSAFPMDVNGDGKPDIITGGWSSGTLRWRENPGNINDKWTTHDVDNCGNIERNCFWDIDADGTLEVVPNLPYAKLFVYKLVHDPNGKPLGEFKKHLIWDEYQGHGLGFGDINGDNRGDFVMVNGWLEAPEKPYEQKWSWHPVPEFAIGMVSVEMPVWDVNHDGLNDIIIGNGHGYGLYWFEQKIDGENNRTWIKHEIESDRSQWHDVKLADIDKDGELEIISGKRWKAHGELDPGSSDPLGLYYFKNDGKGNFKLVTINYGPLGKASGAGIYFWLADMDKNGYDDIIAPGKDGLYLFYNLGNGK